MQRGNLASGKLFLAGNSSWVSLSKCLIINLPQVAHGVSYLRQVTNQVARQSCRDFSTRGLSIFCSFVPNDCDDVHRTAPHRTAFGCWRLPFASRGGLKAVGVQRPLVADCRHVRTAALDPLPTFVPLSSSAHSSRSRNTLDRRLRRVGTRTSTAQPASVQTPAATASAPDRQEPGPGEPARPVVAAGSGPRTSSPRPAPRAAG